MSDIVFQPWVGNKFNGDNRFGVRVLILGESHYGQESEIQPTVTTEVVRLLAQQKRHAFFTKLSKLLLGLDGKTWIDNNTRGEVWEHIAFYNYIQSFVSDSRVRPSTEMWDAAREPFLGIFHDLKPDVVLVLGKELATHVPTLPEKIDVCCIQHPSTGFDYKEWNPLFAEAIQRAKRDQR